MISLAHDRFNHVLLHFVLHNKNLVPKPVKWKYSFGELNPVKNTQLIASLPTLAYAFKSCSQARNANLPNHLWNEYRSRFNRYVTYPERDKIMSQLRAACPNHKRLPISRDSSCSGNNNIVQTHLVLEETRVMTNLLYLDIIC